MSKAFAAVFGVLVVAAGAFGAPPALEIPSEVKPANGYATVRPKTDAKAVTYIALDAVYPFPSDLLADKRMFVLPAQGLAAGRYRFVAVGSLNDEHTTVEFAVVVGNGPGPTPPVPPGPTPPPPGPTPDPTPLTKSKLWAVFVEESDGAAVDRAAVFGPLQLGDYMARNGHKWRIVDKDVVGADGKPPKDVERFIKDAAGKTLPMLYLVDEKGHTRYSGPAPAKSSALIDLMNQYAGK